MMTTILPRYSRQTCKMSSNKALQASVLSLQSDVPFMLGRRAASKPVTTTSNNLDKVATTALKAKALASQSSTHAAVSSVKQQLSMQAPVSSGPPHWSQGLVRPPRQQAELYWPSPHYWTPSSKVDLSASNPGTSASRSRIVQK